MNKNPLAKEYTLGSLVRFALPSIVMMLVLSIYNIADGTFVSRYVGATALSAVNMVYPAVSIEMAIAIMLSAGGSAVIARKMGQGKLTKAREDFTLIVLAEIIIGVIVAIFGNLLIEPIIIGLGATQAQFEFCKTYLRILLCFVPFFFLESAFQNLFVTAGNPKLGLAATLISGAVDFMLNYVFVARMGMGVAGAAVSTGIGYVIVAITGIIYFFRKKETLYFVKPRKDFCLLTESCVNGSSEMLSYLATALTTFLFNFMFLKYLGEDGVAAITITLYFQYVFTAVYTGYSNGIASIISYKYGEENHHQLQTILKSSLLLTAVTSLIGFILARVVVGIALTIFTPRGSTVYLLTQSGFRYFSLAFLFMGICIFISVWFTALSKGKTGAVISFVRTFFVPCAAVFLLPMLFETTGIWLAIPCAEAVGIVVAIILLKKNRQFWSK